MKTYAEMSREELLSEKASLEERYNEFKASSLIFPLLLMMLPIMFQTALM